MDIALRQLTVDLAVLAVLGVMLLVVVVIIVAVGMGIAVLEFEELFEFLLRFLGSAEGADGPPDFGDPGEETVMRGFGQ